MRSIEQGVILIKTKDGLHGFGAISIMIAVDLLLLMILAISEL